MKLIFELSETGKSMAVSHFLFPNIDLFGRYVIPPKQLECMPLPLNEMFTLIKDPKLSTSHSVKIFIALVLLSQCQFLLNQL